MNGIELLCFTCGRLTAVDDVTDKQAPKACPHCGSQTMVTIHLGCHCTIPGGG